MGVGGCIHRSVYDVNPLTVCRVSNNQRNFAFSRGPGQSDLRTAYSGTSRLIRYFTNHFLPDVQPRRKDLDGGRPERNLPQPRSPQRVQCSGVLPACISGVRHYQQFHVSSSACCPRAYPGVEAVAEVAAAMSTIEQGAVTVRYETQTNRAKVLAALNTVCLSCGYSISPAEIVRLDSERMRCPKCGKLFKAGNPDLYRKRTERGH